MKLSLSNGIFSKYPLEENLAIIRRLGFENIEFNMKSVEKQSDDSPEPAKKLIASYGLKCVTVHSATLHVKNESEVPTAIYYGLVSANFAYALSAPIMVVHSDVSRKLSTNLRKKLLTKIFGELKPYAEGFGLKLALENLSYASNGYGKNVAELEEILHVIDNGAMGITLDFCHAEATGQTFNLLEKYHEKLCNIHMSNRAHKPFTEETPKLTTLLNKLRECRYNGPITMELNRNCTLEEITKTKLILEKNLKN